MQTKPAKRPFEDGSSVPPILLLLDEHSDTRDMYTTFFQREGFWVATAEDADEAVQVASDLKPNVIVADLEMAGALGGTNLVEAFKTQPTTHDIPVVILSGRPIQRLPPSTRQADLLLEIPIRPDELLRQVRALLVRAAELRRRSDETRQTGRRLMAKSEKLLQQSRDISNQLIANARKCPDCSAGLEWIEQGVIGGVEYDFYRWCHNGCGLSVSTGPPTAGCG
jgi:DNA-binding response OmpR family regulator